MGKRREAGRERWTEHRVTSGEAGRTVKEILREEMGVSGRMIQRLTRSGGIRLNRGAAHLARQVVEGDRVAVRIAREERSELPPVATPLAIVYEDDDLVVVDKPAGLLVHPVRPEHDRTLAHGLAHHFREQGRDIRVRPVHRLDRDTSGLLVVAKTSFAHQRLDAQLRDGTFQRSYLALVANAPEWERTTIEAPIAPHPARRDLRAVAPEGTPALTRARVVERYAGGALLELELETGRTHQIRVHLAHSGHPVIGDRAYGGPAAPGLRRQALHAARLAFRHPVDGREMRFSSGLPSDLADLRERLAGLQAPPTASP